MAASIEDIKKLRTMTGAGLSACKDALNEANNDFKRAMEIIREKGQAVAAKRSDRTASEGCVLGAVKGSTGAIVALKCETDFVARGEKCVKLTQDILNLALENKPASLDALKQLKIGNDTVETLITDLSGITGEKFELGDCQIIEAPSLYAYIHPGNKLVALVGFNQENADANVMKEVAMQVAAMNPIALSPKDVPAENIEQEKKIARDKAIEAGKPENILDRIAEGAVQKYYKEYCLLNQEYNRDPKINMSQFMDKASKGLTVTAFKRVTLNAE